MMRDPADGRRLIEVQIRFKPMDVPPGLCLFQRACKDPEDGELCPFYGEDAEFFERPAGPQQSRLF